MASVSLRSVNALDYKLSFNFAPLYIHLMGGDAQRREIDKKKKRVVADGHFPGGVAKAKVSELLSSNRAPDRQEQFPLLPSD